MKRLLKIGPWIACLLVLGACQDGGRKGVTGNVCEPNMDPLKVGMPKDSKARKIDLADVPDLGNFPGLYEYSGAEIFYRNTKTGQQIYLKESKNPKAPTGFSVQRVCVSGFSEKQAPFSYNMGLLSGMEVSSSPSAKDPVSSVKGIKARTFYVVWKNETILANPSEELKGGEFDKPSKAVEGKVNEFQFYKDSEKSDSAFQLRSKMTEGTEFMAVVVHYKRTVPTPAKP